LEKDNRLLLARIAALEVKGSPSHDMQLEVIVSLNQQVEDQIRRYHQLEATAR
jgi:hypothetical protein